MTDAVVVVVVAAVSVLRLDVICEPGVKVGRKVALVAFVLQPIAVALSDVTLQRLEAVELGGAELAGVDVLSGKFSSSLECFVRKWFRRSEEVLAQKWQWRHFSPLSSFRWDLPGMPELKLLAMASTSAFEVNVTGLAGFLCLDLR